MRQRFIAYLSTNVYAIHTTQYSWTLSTAQTSCHALYNANFATTASLLFSYGVCRRRRRQRWCNIESCTRYYCHLANVFRCNRQQPFHILFLFFLLHILAECQFTSIDERIKTISTIFFIFKQIMIYIVSICNGANRISCNRVHSSSLILYFLPFIAMSNASWV